VVIQREFGGYVIGVLELDQIQDHLDKSTSENTSLYTLLDKNGKVIMTNRTDQKIMAPFVRSKGTLNRLDNKISQWVPVVLPNTPISERWKKSFYVSETAIGNLAEWKLILEQPVAPFQKMLYDEYTGKLILLFLILLGSLALGELLSRRIVVTLEKLRTLTHDLPLKLATDGKDIVWPESGIQEANHLISNFREMADSLSEQFFETRQINETLEQRVEERTEELRKAHHEMEVHQIELEQQNEELRHMQNELDSVRARYFDLYDLAPIGYLTLNEHGFFLEANLAASSMLGLERKFLLKNTISKFIFPEDENVYYLHRKKLVELNDVQAYEMRLLRADGSFFWANLRAVPAHNCEQWITFIDITERKLAEEELLQAKATAELANSAKSQFLANMSHEIRTPMNGLLGMAQLLEMTELTTEQREYTAALKQCGKNLMSLMNDILDLTKIEAGKITIELAEFSLHQCIKDIVLMQKQVINEKGLQLDVNVAEDIPYIMVGDQLRIKQILLNLIGNSVKFTKQGNISISVRLVELHDSNVIVQLAVQDSGIGISSGSLDQIFNPFVQEDGSTTRNFGGTGLGLTISRRLVELMGGNISVESTQGAGSCFTVTLPFNFTHRAEPVLQTHITTVSNCNGQSLRILFVEDNTISIDFGRSLLKKLGHEVTAVENGKECIVALEQGKFDLVLMDINMPVMNGEDALREIRRKEQGTTSHLPVIALTAYSMRGDRERFIEEGFDGYVSKPLTVNELVDEMGRVMESRLKVEG